MRNKVGLVLAVFVGVACGHATPTGCAKNGWDTPTGYASATDPRYLNPNAGAQPAHDRSVFEQREAPPLQTPANETATPPSEPPDSALPPPETAPVPEPAPLPEPVPPPESSVPDSSVPPMQQP